MTGRVLTNSVSLAYGVQSAISTDPTVWKQLEPNSIGKFGAELRTVSRAPISKNRQRNKGTIVDLDSMAEFEHDLTLEAFVDFIEGFCFATQATGQHDLMVYRPTSVTTSGYVIPTGSALVANTLVFARGFAVAANNGLKVVGASSTTTLIHNTTTTAETTTDAQNATVEVCGVVSSTGDLDVDSSGRITSTSLNFTTLGLTVGQMIHVGGASAGLKFVNAANYGFARITAIAANLLTLDKKTQAFATEANTTTTPYLLWGRFIRNVPVGDSKYLERYFQFEKTFPNLGTAGVNVYEYSIDNLCDEVTFNLPLANKATCQFGFVGTNTTAPTETRKSGASTARATVQRDVFNTTPDIARLRILLTDETGIATDFKDVKLKLKNNVSPEKVIGTLGARFMNTGMFEVNVEAKLLYTDKAVMDAIRANTTVGLDFVLRGDDGAIGVDIPSMYLNSGNKEYPVNASVLINAPGEAFADPTLNVSIAVTIFPYVPSS